MEFSGIKLINIDMLGLSQIYLNLNKITSVTKWFDPQCMDNSQPLTVYDFCNGKYTITDGHTRAYVAYKNGVSVLPVYMIMMRLLRGKLGSCYIKQILSGVKGLNYLV